MAAWMELLGMLGGTLDEGAGGAVSQSSLADLLGTYFEFASKTIPNSDQMGLPIGYITATDAALMGAVLVAQRVAQPVTPVVISRTTLVAGDTTSIAGQVPTAPVVGFFKDPDDPTLFAAAPQATVFHAQIGIVPRTTGFAWIDEATEFRIERFLGHEENNQVVKDWTLLTDVPSGIVWDFYIRSDLTIGYRIKFRGAGETEWSAWHPGNETALASDRIATKPGRDVDPVVNVGIDV